MRLLTRIVTLAIGVLLTATPTTARAFHNGKTFDRPAGSGGAGGIYYLGTPLERGWDCTACHEGAVGKVRMKLDLDPALLASDLAYSPGATYEFTVHLVGEHLGLASGTNYNGFGVAVVDGRGFSTGEAKFAEGLGQFYSPGGATLLSDPTSPDEVGQTTWTFAWKAPDDAGLGAVALHFAVVDGNGADSKEIVQDPEGDDVFITKVILGEAPSMMGLSLPRRSESLLLGAFALTLLFVRRRSLPPSL